MKRARQGRPAWMVWLVAGGGLVLVGLGQGLPNRDSIEQNLTRRSVAALEAGGVSGAQVTFAGRDGALLIPHKDVDRARAIVEAVEGVRVVSVRAIEVAVKADPVVSVTVDGMKVTVSGRVPSAAAKAALGSLAPGLEQVTVDDGVGEAGLAGLAGVIRALGDDAKGARVELRDGRMTLSGKVSSERARDATAAAAGQAVGARNVVNQLEIELPAVVVQRELAGLAQITFEDDSATLTPAGQVVVAKVAGLLKAHPGAKVRIEGHTDGNGTAESNLVLSQARARTVLDALVALGVTADRLVAAGFGETRHRVPDTSPENRAINRRVEFVVVS